MDKTTFLTDLRQALSGELDYRRVDEHMGYYREYIDISLRKGMSEDELFNSLGEPRLIAKTIVDMEKNSESNRETYGGSNPYNTSSVNHAKNAEENTEDSKSKKAFRLLRLSGWRLVLAIIIAVLIVFMIISLFLAAWPIILILIIINIIVTHFWRRGES